jgi:hypothetical protein
VLVAAAVLAIVLASSGGGSSSKGNAAGARSPAAVAASRHVHTRSSRTASKSSSAAGSRAEAQVAVLNGTETTGLAHRVAGQLQQGGFTKSFALGGRPPGANQVTVVEYASGHRGDAEGVARSLGAGQPQPIEAGVASLSGSATVVVIVGLDKAATGP